MSEKRTTETTPERQTRRIDFSFSPWQYEALVRCDHYKILNLIGGRGSGKSYIEAPRVARWMKLATDLHYGIFGATDTVLQTILAPIRQLVESMSLDHVYEREAPSAWRTRWDADGIRYPPRRLRSHKIWIIENGLHIITGSLMNNAYTRFKSIEFNQIYIGESTEPGVTKNALLTLLAACRCGRAQRDPDGVWRCHEIGHLHNMVLAGNVPLNDPGHYIYRFNDNMEKQEIKRKAEKRRAFYRLINSATKDNPYTGADYDDMLRSAMDEQTYVQQTSGKLERNRNALTYYAFSDRNILPNAAEPNREPKYDTKRALHMWFDFNTVPATSGFGHDLTLNEVPEMDRRTAGDHHYFAILGELFSGVTPMQTEQVAYALLEDPHARARQADARCLDCRCLLREHIELPGAGHMCRSCMHVTSERAGDSKRRYCSGEVFRDVSMGDEAGSASRFIHAPDNWRGLLNHRADIYIYGDASGKATHADSSIVGGSRAILKAIFSEALGDRVHFRFKEANPNIKHRLIAVNRGFLSGVGVHSFFIASRCTAHIADGREVVPDPNTNEPLKVSMPKGNSDPDHYAMRTHSFDGFGYMVDYRWPFDPPKASDLPWMSGGEGDGGSLAVPWR